MSTKTKPAVTPPLKAMPDMPMLEPELAYKRVWNVAQRILAAKQHLRTTKLWEKFENERSFDAFSIHTLARGVEEVLGQFGINSKFHMTTWKKLGHTTVVEGLTILVNVDRPEDIDQTPTAGEGLDDSDKGIGKAISYARKNGLIQALNLGIGVDNEASNPKTAGPQQPVSGTPQQDSRSAVNMNPAPETNGKPANGKQVSDVETYVLQAQGMKAKGLFAKDIVGQSWSHIVNASTSDSLRAFWELNSEEFDRLKDRVPLVYSQLYGMYAAQLKTLADKGR